MVSERIDALGRNGVDRLRWAEVGIALTVYLGATAWLFHPLWPHFSSSVVGAPSDNVGYLWTLWYGHAALLGAQSLLETKLLFHPEGTSLAYHVYSWLNLLLALPLRPFLELPALYNLLVLQTFPVAGLGAFLLIRLWVRDTLSAVVGGFVFAFNPVHVAYSSVQINTASIQMLPFFVFFFVRTLRSPGWKNRLGAALFFLLNAMASWYYLVYALGLVTLGVVFESWKGRLREALRISREGGLVVALGLSPLLPWILFMVWSALDAPGALAAAGHDVFVADLLGFVTPHSSHRLADWSLVSALDARFTGNPAGRTAYLGWVPMGLALYALRRAPRSEALERALFMGLAFALVAMGSHLHVAGRITSIPLPTLLLEKLPFFGSMRVPNRALVVTYLALALLAARGLEEWRRRTRSRPGTGLGLAFLCTLVWLDGPTTVRGRTPFDPPSAYDAIARDEPGMGLLDLPLTPTNAALYLAYQTRHGIPLVEGYIGRQLHVSLIERIRDLPPREQLAELRRHRVRWIVVHANPPEARSRAARVRAFWLSLGLPILLEDDRVTIFRIPSARLGEDPPADRDPLLGVDGDRLERVDPPQSETQPPAIRELDREAGAGVQLEHQGAEVAVEHDVDAEVAEGHELVAARREHQQPVPARDLDAGDRDIRIRMDRDRPAGTDRVGGATGLEVDSAADGSLMQIRFAVGSTGGQTDHRGQRNPPIHDRADVGHALERDVLEDGIEFDAAFDEGLIRSSAQAVHARQDVGDVMGEARCIQVGAARTEIAPVPNGADDENAAASAAVGGLDHEAFASREDAIEAADLELGRDDGVELGKRDPGRLGQRLGLRLVVDQGIETARIPGGDAFEVARVHAEDAAIGEPLGRRSPAHDVPAPFIHMLRKRQSSVIRYPV